MSTIDYEAPRVNGTQNVCHSGTDILCPIKSFHDHHCISRVSHSSFIHAQDSSTLFRQQCAQFERMNNAFQSSFTTFLLSEFFHSYEQPHNRFLGKEA